MSLINCNKGIKLKWLKYCVLSTAGADYLTNDNSDNIIFWYYYHVVTYQQKTIKNYQNILVKDLKDYFIGMIIKQKVRTQV